MAPKERDEMRSGGRNYMPREQRRKKQVGVSECTSSDAAARTKKKALTGISGFLGSCSIFTRLADMGDMQMHLEERSKMPRRE